MKPSDLLYLEIRAFELLSHATRYNWPELGNLEVREGWFPLSFLENELKILRGGKEAIGLIDRIAQSLAERGIIEYRPKRPSDGKEIFVGLTKEEKAGLPLP